MKRRSHVGYPVYHYYGPGLASARRHWAFGKGEKWWWVIDGDLWYLWHYDRLTGVYLVCADRVDGPTRTRLWNGPYVVGDMGIKRRALAQAQSPKPELSRETKAFGKWPGVMEFISATVFDDGVNREPGYYTMRNRGSSYELTLYDPNAGLRLAINAATVDACYAQAEQLLGVDEAQWQVDQYLASRLPKEKKKK